jgi:hypothetical protein
MPTRGSLQLYFVRIFYLAYIIIILLAHSKSVTINICENKYIYNTRPCRTLRAVDPAKRGLERTNIEPAMHDFRPGAKRACQLTAQIDGIDRDFLFGNARPPLPSHPGCSSFPSYLGATQVGRGLAPVYINYFIVYLGFETIFGSPGTSPGTLTSWVGVWGEIPLYVFLQVSIRLYLLVINTIDVNKGNWAHFELSLCDFRPPLQGGQKSQKS